MKKSASTVSKKRYKVSITKLVVKSIGKIFSKGFIIYDSILEVNDFINEASRHDLIKGDKFSIKISASTISWKRYKISITKLAERSQMRVLKSSTDYFSEKELKFHPRLLKSLKALQTSKWTNLPSKKGMKQR